MLIIKHDDWLVNEVEGQQAYFKTKIESLNDARIYDLSYAIEKAENTIKYDGRKFLVVDYGIKQSYENENGNAFYILARPLA